MIIRWIRWETESSWYEAQLLKDLLGHFILTRRWGRLDEPPIRSIVCVVYSWDDAQARFKKVLERRTMNKEPYSKIVDRTELPEKQIDATSIQEL